MTKQHNAVWYYFTILCLLLSASMPMSVADQGMVVIIYPDPPIFTVNLTGGDTFTENIIVKWTGDTSVLCNISTNITSDCPGNDSEGISVTYSENPVNLSSNTPKTITMTIKAAINIMPGIYIITTNFSCTAEEEDEDGDGGNGGGGGGPRDNIHPIADASTVEPTGTVGEEITFNGSKSFDPDGTIIKWYWDFGDKTNGTGEVTNHTYSNPGTYNVTLTVTDNRNAIDSYETAVVVRQPNRPPEYPIVDGVTMGNKTVEYAYTAVSIDPDNDTIRYFFDWGDGANTTSAFLASGITCNMSHNWTTSGVYMITIYAKDENNALSGTTEMTVFIDMNIQFIDDVIQGYLLDTDNDGIYDIFHNNATGNETTVELQNNGKYLIDGDNDTLWDYEYDPETSTLNAYAPSSEEEEKDIAPWYALVALIVIAAIGVTSFVYFVQHVKKKEKDKGQKKKTKKKTKETKKKTKETKTRIKE